MMKATGLRAFLLVQNSNADGVKCHAKSLKCVSQINALHQFSPPEGQPRGHFGIFFLTLLGDGGKKLDYHLCLNILGLLGITISSN